MRLLIQHRSHYRYPSPATLGRHLVRLRPANHTKAKVETYALQIRQDAKIRWQQDPSGNHVAHVLFPGDKPITELDLLVELSVEIKPVNPFDFTIDVGCRSLPFSYPAAARRDLGPFLGASDVASAPDGLGARTAQFFETLPSKGSTVDAIVAINGAVNKRIKYVIREESGIWTPEETLTEGRGSCRDSAVLLVAALRSRGLAARFVSGYLVQLTDEGMIPDQPRGVSRDVVDLHAWAEVYLPGAGWVGLDATSGLLCGEGHIPLACTAYPPLASPIDGTSDVLADDVSFEMVVGRLGHEARPTAPYTEEVWQELLAAGDRADEALLAHDVRLTAGGEPTFNSREHVALPEWNSDALGATKYAAGVTLMAELRRRLAPGAAVLTRQGKTYPGESLPRWALDLCGRTDGRTVWHDLEPGRKQGTTLTELAQGADRLAHALARELDLAGFVVQAFEDPWRYLQEEASLPIDVDPLAYDLGAPEERKRLARVLDRGVGEVVGHVLPLKKENGRWQSEHWEFRRGRLFLLPGDSPLGFRLPLRSLGPVPPPLRPPWDPAVSPPDPRAIPAEAEEAQRSEFVRAHAAAILRAKGMLVRTALDVELRAGKIWVFLPPVDTVEDFFELVTLVDRTKSALGIDVSLEGYPPPPGPGVYRFAVTPDPGVLEVNLPPTTRSREHAQLLDTVFDAAFHSGLHAEKYLLDGRQAGSGGGHHITLGGATALESPFIKRPDLLASLLTFVQHHPSLSYMFTGLFVGPTSQAPRIDEARHESLAELELALARAFESRSDAFRLAEGSVPPWLGDILFRHLLVDVAGNTHRTEISIDKLFDPQTPHGRQGLVELRAFEMPPHVRMAAAQVTLVRTLIASFAQKPYRAPLVRWGQGLHDRFLLPFYLWRDFEDVLEHLEAGGVPLPEAAYRPFVELRCPLAGQLRAGDVMVEVRNALEPWHVLGEEMTAAGTSRYVDSSMERIEVRADGLVPERHVLLVNGQVLPLRPTHIAGKMVGGIRFRAWAPPHSLHAHIGIHHPLKLDVLDTWSKRSIGAAAYHVWHPEGRGYEAAPLTRFEAVARRAQRFTVEGPTPWPANAKPTSVHPDAPYTLDLRRLPLDRPPPNEDPAEEDEAREG